MAKQKVIVTIAETGRKLSFRVPGGTDARTVMASYVTLFEGETIGKVEIDGVEDLGTKGHYARPRSR